MYINVHYRCFSGSPVLSGSAEATSPPLEEALVAMAKFTAGEVQAAMENISTDGDERGKAVRALTVAWLFDFSA